MTTKIVWTKLPDNSFLFHTENRDPDYKKNKWAIKNGGMWSPLFYAWWWDISNEKWHSINEFANGTSNFM